jgi:hypothetical protein
MREASLGWSAPPSQTTLQGELRVTERPPPGFGRGTYPVPAAVVVGLSALLVLVALGYALARRKRSARS